MKKSSFLFSALLLLVFSFASCDKDDEITIPVDSTLPLITITAPAANAVLEPGVSFHITGSITDNTNLKSWAWVVAKKAAKKTDNADWAATGGADISGVKYDFDKEITVPATAVEGEYTITFSAKDAADNAANVVVNTVTVTAPASK